MNRAKLAFSLAIIAILQGCVAAAGVVVVGSASVITDNRSFGKQIDDQTIKFNAQSALSSDDAISKQTNLAVSSINGSLLVVGQSPTPHLRDRAIKLLSDIEGVVQIHNQIRIGNVTSITTQTNDAWLTTKVKTKLFGSDNLDATNIKVITENGEVFLMGLVEKKDADEAVEITRHIGGVNKVYKMFEYQ